MSESDKEALYEQHAARLHALLRDERVAQAGLPTDDIVRALGLPEADVNAIMVVAESREIVELDLSSSQALWRSKSRLPQDLSLPSPPGGARQTRPAWVTPLVVGLALLAALLGFTMKSPAPEVSPPAAVSPEVSPKAPVAPTEQVQAPATREERIEARTDAAYAGMQLTRHREELKTLEARIAGWREAAKTADCAPRWGAGETCYIKGRHLTQVAYDKEAGALTLRANETRAIIETYQGN